MAKGICGGAIRLRSLWLAGALGFGLSGAATAAEVWLPAMESAVGNHRTPNEQSGFSDEFPAHGVELASFYLSAGETTKAEWDEVRAWGLAHGYDDLPEGSGGAGAAPGEAKDHPVVAVSWYDAAKWCNALSEMEGSFPAYGLDEYVRIPFRTGEVERLHVLWNGSGWRLPSEREWELAARGGLESNDYPWSASSPFFEENISETQAQFRAGGTRPTGQFAANGFGLHDMAGNVAEWCGDWYDADAYELANGGADFAHGPDDPPVERVKSVRGGSWRSEPADLRVAARSMAHPSRRQDHVGFRPARTFVPSPQNGAIERFTATEEEGRVVVRWWTTDESEVDGFWVSRYENGIWVPAQAEWVAPAGGGAGAAYVLVDTHALPGAEYRYRVEMATHGEVLVRGPFDRTATALRFTRPVVRVPGGMQLRWESRPDERYLIRRATNLLHPPEILPMPLETNLFVDTHPPPAAFYGIQMLAPPAP